MASMPRQGDNLIGPTIQNLLSSPLVFIFGCLVLTVFTWPIRWFVSGAPVLQFVILLGDSAGKRVLPFLHVWPIFTTLHFVYAICSTSWLLYWLFTTLCYLTIAVVCLVQFDWAAERARHLMRKVMAGLHFIDDKIAFFEIPALEIDQEVDGLLVLRGITFSLSTLSFVVHGVEVGIKLTEDMELAIQTEEVRIKLFRRIDIGNVFANIKGGKYEMTFGSLPTPTALDRNGDAMFITGTSILNAALKRGDVRRPDMVKMTSQFTGGKSPGSTTPGEGFEAMEKITGTEGDASKKYRRRVRFIHETNAINEARKHIKSSDEDVDEHDESKVLAAICSALHSTPSVPHPPELAIKVSTIKSMSKPSTKRFIHRLPLLLRLLLNPICYFHPVYIDSITASASGRWIDTLLLSQLFKTYHEQDKEIASLHSRISAWLSDANFVLELSGIKGIAQVSVNSAYDIINNLTFNNVLAYRSIPRPNTEFNDLTQVLSLAGADLTVTLPSYLLPRHEHLLPPKPVSTNSSMDSVITTSNMSTLGTPANPLLDKILEDNAIMKVAAHVRLPAVLNQDLLDFTAVLVKASKIVELEKELETISSQPASSSSSPILKPVGRAHTASVIDDAASISSMVSEADSEFSNYSEREDEESVSRRRAFSNKIKGGLRVGVKRMVVDTVVNERWIARLVGRITRKLEKAKGEVGYVAEVKLPLAYYRAKGEGEAEKILP